MDRPVGPHGIGEPSPGRAEREVEGAEPEPGREGGGHHEGQGPADRQGHGLPPSPRVDVDEGDPHRERRERHRADVGRSGEDLQTDREAEDEGVAGAPALDGPLGGEEDGGDPRGAREVVPEVHEREEGARQHPGGSAGQGCARSQPPAPRQRVERDPGQEDVAEGEERVVGPGAHEEVQPGRRVEDLHRRVGEERLPERGTRVPERQSTREDRAHEPLDLGVPDEVDVPLVEDAALEDRLAEEGDDEQGEGEERQAVGLRERPHAAALSAGSAARR